jgi:hypothetical protein
MFARIAAVVVFLASAGAMAQDDTSVPSAEAVGSAGVGKGVFGLRVGFVTNGWVAMNAAGIPGFGGAPMVSAKYMASDELGLVFDAGFGLVTTNPIGFAATAGLGIEYHLRGVGAKLRPIFAGGMRFMRDFAGLNAVGIEFGGGAEYFVSRNLSFTGKAMLAIPIVFVAGGATAVIATVTPGVCATFYF